MVDVEVTRLPFEVLAKTPEIVAVTRLTADVVHTIGEADSSAEMQVTRLPFEVLGVPPTCAAVTRLNVEVAHTIGEADSSADIEVTRLPWEALAQSPACIGVTRLTTEIAHTIGEADATTDMAVTRLVYEALGPKPVLVNPCTLPPLFDFFAHNWASDMVMDTVFRTSLRSSPTSVAEDRWQLIERPLRNIAVRFSTSLPRQRSWGATSVTPTSRARAVS